MTNNKKLGNWGELFVKQYLIKKGYSFIASNVKVGRLEIDLIFSCRNKVVFIEVKTRQKNLNSIHDNPLSPRQKNNLQEAILRYCLLNKINFDNIRLDLIALFVDKLKHQVELKHYQNVF